MVSMRLVGHVGGYYSEGELPFVRATAGNRTRSPSSASVAKDSSTPEAS
jgi:hypothetical protein